jgi:hypothetical protein
MPIYTCPVCTSAAELYDVVDFNKNCEERNGLYLPKSGRAIYYAQCTVCQFLFAPEFQHWTQEDFKLNIYNQHYQKYDPEFESVRPKKNFNLLERLFGKFKENIKHLDYGGGQGRLSELLNQNGWSSKSYDPFIGLTSPTTSDETYDLVTAFEVFEHEPLPHSLIKKINGVIHADSLVFFSTLLSDQYISKNERLSWWYAAPRNGHCSIYSRSSIELLAQSNLLRLASMGPSYHVYFKNFPDWAIGLLSN